MTFRVDFEHRDDLLRSAIEEFCERGYDAASINRILAASGVSKGQLYHHFASKEALYLALVEWMIDQKTEWLAGRPFELDDDFFATLGAQLRAAVDFASAQPDVEGLSRAVLRERGRPIFAAVVERFAFDPSSALGMLVAHFHAQGQFRAGVSPDLAQRAVLLVVNHLPELLDLDEPGDLTAQVDAVLAFLQGGLSRK